MLANMFEPSMLFSGIVIGMVGLGLFLYGKRSGDYASLTAGLALNVFPFFTHSMLTMWALAGACVIGLYAHKRFA